LDGVMVDISQPYPHPPYSPRRIAWRVEEALSDTRVVLISGPRQAGKSTLAQRFATPARRYVTLDDGPTLAAAQTDPTGFIRSLNSAVIDEIQRVPALMLAIKETVDRDPRPGRFLLTGSANVMALPQIGDSLAGRIALIDLLPFAQCELRDAPGTMIDRLFDGKRPSWDGPAETGQALLDTILAGGYPEAVRRATPARRSAWLRDYLKLVLDRDVRDIADLNQQHLLPKLMAMLSEHAGQLTVAANLANAIGVSIQTAQRYVTVLERLYLVQLTQPWHSNHLSRLLKTPKTHFLDSGLLAALRGDTAKSFALDRSRLGPITECFALSEIKKLLTWSDVQVSLTHFRTKDGDEVDFVLEDSRGRIVGIEVKSTATLSMKDFSGLKKLQQAAGDRFVYGVLLHDHDRITPIAERICGAPLSLLWQM
jgi:uncharacterized protein